MKEYTFEKQQKQKIGPLRGTKDEILNPILSNKIEITAIPNK
jgi:hypothetical protein